MILTSLRLTNLQYLFATKFNVLSFRHLLEKRFFFAWRFILNETFVLIDHILSKTICRFSFCVLFSNMYPKIKFIAKHWSNLCNFYSKVIFLEFLSETFFLLFFVEFEFLMFHNIVKISEKLNKQNLLKICLPVTYPTNFCIICIHFYYGKKWKYLSFEKPFTRITFFFFFCIGSYDKWFFIKSWQKANLLLLCKMPSKNDFLKDDFVENTVVSFNYYYYSSIL